MNILRNLLTSAGADGFQPLESRRLLAGDLGVYDVACDAKVNWLVPGDKFNLVVTLANESQDAAAVGKVYVDIYAQDESGEEIFLGDKSNINVNLGPKTLPLPKTSKVTVPITLGFNVDPGLYRFVAKISPMLSADETPLYLDDSDSNNELSTADSSTQSQYLWQFAYRVGTYDLASDPAFVNGDIFPGDPRASLRNNVKMSGLVQEELYDESGAPVDANNDGFTDIVVNKYAASLTGPGYAEGLFDSSTAVVRFVGTNIASAFSATFTGGRSSVYQHNQTDLEAINIVVEGSLKSLKAPGFNFNACTIDVMGSIGDFSCNYFEASSMTVGDESSRASMGAFSAKRMYGSDLTVYGIASTAGGAKITTGTKITVTNDVVDSEIRSTGRITSVSVGSWSGGQLEADTIGTFDSKANMTGSIFTNGVNREIIDNAEDGQPGDPNLTLVALTKLSVKGIAAGLWDFDGGVGSISIGSVQRIDDGDSVTGQLFITIAGKLGTFAATGDIWGDIGGSDSAGLGLYAFSMNSVTFNRNVYNSEIKSGVAFPYAGDPWFPTQPQLRQTIGSIGSFTVKGNLGDSIVRAGYNPDLGDLNPGLLQISEIKKIAVGGSLMGSTEFLAKLLPVSVKVKVDGIARTIRRDPDSAPAPQLFEYNSNDLPWMRTNA